MGLNPTEALSAASDPLSATWAPPAKTVESRNLDLMRECTGEDGIVYQGGPKRHPDGSFKEPREAALLRDVAHYLHGRLCTFATTRHTGCMATATGLAVPTCGAAHTPEKGVVTKILPVLHQLSLPGACIAKNFHHWQASTSTKRGIEHPCNRIQQKAALDLALSPGGKFLRQCTRRCSSTCRHWSFIQPRTVMSARSAFAALQAKRGMFSVSALVSGLKGLHGEKRRAEARRAFVVKRTQTHHRTR